MPVNGFAGLSVLVVEDETLLRKQLAAALERFEADVTSVATLNGARALLRDLDFDFALLDVNLPDGKGTDLLRDQAFSSHTAVVIMTADGGVDGAVEAMRLGALDYLVKPFDPAELPLVFNRARKARQTTRIEELKREKETGGLFYFGSSLASVESQLNKILAADRRLQGDLPPVLIEGETGTGKTTIARWLHHNGPRASQPLVEMNCSAVTETLAESELFGHERGAFTDARTARMGLFEAAHGGTLFLDELSSLSPAVQVKLLKAIEDRNIRRVGGQKSIPINVRVIAATNRDLRKMMAEGAFREDLYHRLDLCRIFLPPLRERADDILALAESFIQRLCERHRVPPRKITDSGRRRLLACRWPGNVRELAHELERAIIFEESAELDFPQLAPGIPGIAPEAPTSTQPSADWFREGFVFPETGFSLENAIDRLARHALKQTKDNVSAAARLLGVTRDYLRYRLGSNPPPAKNRSAEPSDLKDTL